MEVEHVGVERERALHVVGEDGEMVHGDGGHGGSSLWTLDKRPFRPWEFY